MPEAVRPILLVFSICTCGLGFILWGIIELAVAILDAYDTPVNLESPKPLVPLPPADSLAASLPTNEDAEEFELKEWGPHV